MLAHATALVGFLVPVAGHLVGPLIVWLSKRHDSAEIDAHGKESMNFQISMLIWYCVAGILCFVLIGIPILILLTILLPTRLPQCSHVLPHIHTMLIMIRKVKKRENILNVNYHP